MPGDFNGDGTVDSADYVVWRKTDGTQGGFDLWRAHFGETAGGGARATDDTSGAAAPEPASALILMVAAAGLYLQHCRVPKESHRTSG
jgi:hypothetical protein